MEENFKVRKLEKSIKAKWKKMFRYYEEKIDGLLYFMFSDVKIRFSDV